MKSNLQQALGRVTNVLFPQSKSTTVIFPDGGRIATETHVTEQLDAKGEELTEALTFPIVEGTEDPGTIEGKPYIFKDTISRSFTLRYNDASEGIQIMELHPLEA
jgi:hypothetical protein